MTRRSSLFRAALALVLAAVLMVAPGARAQDAPASASTGTPAVEATDPDNCLLCHSFPGLARLDAETGDVRLFFVSERFHADGAGPHTSLSCTGCHDREALKKVPHDEVKPVDCGQTCHLVSSSGSDVEFSHKRPTESLAKSVHKPETLAAQPYGSPLLRDGQSACLYCHDDPTYRMPAVSDTWHRGMDPDVRCHTCHDDSLPVDTNRAIRHVGSRLGDQRPAREAARECAVCHSNTAINEKNELHDAVTSYMRSFHGKASTLGALDAPVCVDCHASEDGNPHLMLAADDPASPTSEANRQLTCLSLGCHDNATPELSAAAVHMRAKPADDTIEYYVTAAFILVICFEMTLDFVLVVLEALNAAFRPLNAEHRHLIALARAVQASPAGRKRLMRLNVHERVQHWVLVLSFLMLVLTGLPMKFPGTDIAGTVAAGFGGLANARIIHRVSAVVISTAFVYHIGYLLVIGKRYFDRLRAADPARPTWRLVLSVVYAWPVVIHPEDVANFARTFLYLFGLRKHRPEQGRFHFSQKFEYMAVFWGMTVIGLSGLMLWREDITSELLGGRALNFAYIVHSYEAFLALIYIAVVHFFAVVFSPAVFPLNLGSLTGDMPPTELGEAHIGYVKQVAAELGITAPPVVVETGARATAKNLALRAYSLLQAFLFAGAGYFVISFLVVELFGGRRAIEVDKVPLRLDAALLERSPDEGASGQGGAVRNDLERGPLAHFHAIPTWYEPDTSNTCTTGGCHTALPHGERKEVRAFLNMHTTFVDCQVCHRDQDLHGTKLAWLSLEDRSVRGAPAVIRLAAKLDEPVPAGERPNVWDDAVRTLLDEAVTESDGDAELQRWKVTVQSSRVGGVRYDRLLADMRDRIGRHGHGEYGTKIGLPADSGKRWAPTPEQLAAITTLRSPDSATLRVDERKALVKTAHQTLKKPEVECQLCHTAENGLIDFGALGYSPARVEALRSNTIAKQAQAVESGETFFLPSVLGGEAAPTPPVEEVKP